MIALGIVLAALLAVGAAPSPDARGAARRFILGAPDRLAAAGDRREPHRTERIASAVAAQADVEAVGDPTWLRQEVETYARRAADCTRPVATPCRREARRIAGAWVIALVAGSHAEIVWTSGRRAARLEWRRLVSAADGTMTVEDPPADFAALLLAELPSDLDARAADDASWAEAEVDRRLYYARRALEMAAEPGQPSAALLRFARAALLAAVGEAVPPRGEAGGQDEGVVAVLAVRARLEAALARRAAARQPLFLSAEPWCAAPALAEALPRLARLP
ncbi:MAG: hypothetical protein U0802_09940 [Candidatus Binatia bacterium]